MTIKKSTKIATVILSCSFLVILSINTQPSYAVTASDWIAGNIIDDSIFTNKNAMSTAQIQTFLDKKVGTGSNGTPGQCDSDGIKISELGGGTRAQYGASHNNPAPFTCLKDYYEVPKTEPGPGIPANNYGGLVIPTGAKSAAQLIWDAAQRYNINPKVLLVKLGTESAGPLTSDDWPFQRQYTYAMGSHCPDSGPGGSANCDPDYAGFSIQIDSAASLLRWYLDSMKQSWWPYKKPYQINKVLWNIEKSGCDGTNIYIGNNATAALYTYTPYQPNPAALANMYGTGDGCSAYGNRNFWRTYTDWFGTVRDYIPLSTPRWMEICNETHKKDPATGEDVDGILSDGMQLKFTSKLLVNGNWYLRSEYDTNNNIEKGVLMNDVEEIQYEKLNVEQYKKIVSNTNKIKPTAGVKDNSLTLLPGNQIKVSSKIFVNGQWYLRTAYDEQNNIDLAIPESSFGEIEYQNFSNPRWMEIGTDTQKINPTTGVKDSTTVTKATQFKFSSKMCIQGIWYFRTSEDTISNQPLAILADDTSDIKYTALSSSGEWLQLSDNTQKIIPNNSLLTDYPLPKGLRLFVKKQITISGVVYYRTAYDDMNNLDKAIPADKFEDIPFTAMENPRIMELAVDTYKKNPATGQNIETLLTKGSKIMFTTKIQINGEWYLRSEFDSLNGFRKAILLTDIK